MAVDEQARQRLYRRLEAVLGEPEAAILMQRLPPEGYGRLATKQDLRGTEASLRKDMEVMEERLGREIHRVARQQTVVYISIMAVLNGMLATSLSLALT